MERVKVWDKEIFIEVHQRLKTVWVATGEYLGQTIVVEDQTKGAAIKRWTEAARYRGNG